MTRRCAGTRSIALRVAVAAAPLVAVASVVLASDNEAPRPSAILGDHLHASAISVVPLGWIEPGRVVRACRFDADVEGVVTGGIVAWDLEADTLEEYSRWAVKGLPYPSPDARHASVWDGGWGLVEMGRDPRRGQPVDIDASALGTPGQFTRDGKTMVFLPQATGGERALQIWDLGSLKLRKEVALGDILGDELAISHDGRLAAVCGSYGAATVIDLRSGRVLAELDPGRCGSKFSLARRAAFSADGSKLYQLVPDGRFLEWTIASKAMRELPSVVDVQRAAVEQAVAVTPPSAGRIAVLDSGARVAIVRTAPFGLLRRVKLVTPAHHVMLSADGRYVVASAGNRLAAHDTGTGKRVAGAVGHGGAVLQLRWNRDGSALTSLAADGSRLAWSVRRGAVEATDWFPPGELQPRVVMSDDGRSVVHETETDMGSEFVTVRNGERTPFLVGELGWGWVGARLLPDASGAIVENREQTETAAFLVGADGKHRARVQVAPGAHAGCRSPDGSRLLTAAKTTAELHDVSSGERLGSAETEGAALALSVSPNGERAAWLEVSNLGWETMDLSLRIVSLPDLKTLDHALLEKGAGRAAVRAWIAWHPTQQTIAVVGRTGAIVARDLGSKSWSDLGALPDRAAATCVSFSPDGTLLAAGLRDGRVALWALSE